MEDLQEIFDRIKDKLTNLTYEDVFPLAKKYNVDDVKQLCIMVGIYLGAVIIAVIMIFGLGWIPFLGVIMKILATLVIIYSTIGIFSSLLTYLKYN
ncbi:MAG: hypothetical protein K6F91_03350 [Ruminococcus sp.]|nr:hypothetical protein [Ruminococcus sp.]